MENGSGQWPLTIRDRCVYHRYASKNRSIRYAERRPAIGRAVLTRMAMITQSEVPRCQRRLAAAREKFL